MPKGYKTLSIRDKSFDTMKKYHERFKIKLSFSDWISTMFETNCGAEMVLKWMEIEANALEAHIKLMDEMKIYKTNKEKIFIESKSKD